MLLFYDSLGENICQEETRYIVPVSRSHKKEGFQFINPVMAPDLSHLVQVSICSHPGEECGGGAAFSLTKTYCEQQYSPHKIVNTTGGFKIIDTLSLPSCCVCKYQRNFFFQFQFCIMLTYCTAQFSQIYFDNDPQIPCLSLSYSATLYQP